METTHNVIQIYYEHRDSHLYKVTLTRSMFHNVEYFEVVNSSLYDGNEIDYRDFGNYFSYKRIARSIRYKKLFLELSIKEPDAFDSYKESKGKDEEKKLLIEANTFYEKVELKGLHYIEINSVADFIKVINMYKMVSLFLKCEELLKDHKLAIRKIEARKDSSSETSYDSPAPDFFDQLEYLEEEAAKKKAEVLNIIKSNNETDKTDNSLNKLLHNFEKLLDINNINNTDKYKPTAAQSELYRTMGEAIRTIYHAIRLFRSGEYAMYYRGVGHIFYPEIPGVFREEFKYEEDREYKEMIMAFPKEFSGMRYLDRVAKLQHFGLPTRLLDVSSNPLVALYMACNTIYTGDPKQEDWGEVLLYFMGGEKDRAYDSKVVLINASLVKLTYVEKTTLFQFICIHEVFINKQNERIQDLLREILNRCIHLAYDLGVNSYLPAQETMTIKKIMKDIVDERISTIEAEKSAGDNSIEDILRMDKETNQLEADRATIDSLDDATQTACNLCWLCMKDVKWPKNGRNWRSVGLTNSDNYNEEVSEHNYHQLFINVIHSYNTLMITIRRENPAFENRINIFDLQKSVHGNIGMTNDRILAQSGSFMISGLDNLYINNRMKSTRSEDFSRIIIKDKKAIVHELQLLNITDATMLPDLSHKAEYMRSQMKSSCIPPIEIWESRIKDESNDKQSQITL